MVPQWLVESLGERIQTGQGYTDGQQRYRAGSYGRLVGLRMHDSGGVFGVVELDNDASRGESDIPIDALRPLRPRLRLG